MVSKSRGKLAAGRAMLTQLGRRFNALKPWQWFVAVYVITLVAYGVFAEGLRHLAHGLAGLGA